MQDARNYLSKFKLKLGLYNYDIKIKNIDCLNCSKSFKSLAKSFENSWTNKFGGLR